MFVVTGITGRVGGIVADTLLQAGLPLRGVVRSADRGEVWRARGCEIAVASDASDAEAHARAFDQATAVFLMNPPSYDPEPGFPDIQGASPAIAHAIRHAKPGRIVFLSTIGAHVTRFNLLNRSGMFEQMLSGTGVAVAHLRAAWFMENAAWDLESARRGTIFSYLQPLDHAIDMVSVRDVGRVAADLLRETWSGVRIVELSGPARYSPRDQAAGFAAALGRLVEVIAIPRADWERRFRDEGMQHPEARMRMLDGFNEGWIDYQRSGTESRRGTVTFDTVLREIVLHG